MKHFTFHSLVNVMADYDGSFHQLVIFKDDDGHYLQFNGADHTLVHLDARDGDDVFPEFFHPMTTDDELESYIMEGIGHHNTVAIVKTAEIVKEDK